MLLKDLEDFFNQTEDGCLEDRYIQTQEFNFFDKQVYDNAVLEESWSLSIPEYNVIIIDATHEPWNEENNDYETDHSLYVFYDLLTDKLIYQEVGSDIIYCLQKFLLQYYQKDLTIDGLLNLYCELNYD